MSTVTHLCGHVGQVSDTAGEKLLTFLTTQWCGPCATARADEYCRQRHITKRIIEPDWVSMERDRVICRIADPLDNYPADHDLTLALLAWVAQWNAEQTKARHGLFVSQIIDEYAKAVMQGAASGPKAE